MLAAILKKVHRPDGGEAGLTIVEVLVASVILVLGAAATFGLLGAAARNGQRAKATQVALDLAQEELERLHSLPYENLAVNSSPKTSSEPSSPNYRVSGGTFAVNRQPRGEYQTLVVNSEKGVAPESEFVSGNAEHGGIKGTLYRYVVWRNDPSCPEAECPGPDDYKQIIVAVKPEKLVDQPGNGGYVEVQSQLSNPQDYEQEPSEPSGGGGEPDPGSDVTAQQFYLSDTPCAASGTTTRVEIKEDHLLHNTLGTCASGLRTGSSQPGAPDALLLTSAPDPDPEDESNPALYDYSDDFYLEPTPDTDKGVQIRRDDTSGCHYNPTGVTHPESQIHRWVTDKMKSNFEMSGKVTFEFYTRTLNDALYTGALCVYLFDREEIGSAEPKAEDTMLVNKANGNAYWEYEPEGNGFWPRNEWTKVRLTMELSAPKTIKKEHRLGVALSVDRANTPADAIPIMYDHPNYPSRIEVDTNTPLESG
jgi:type II secretory pathway pseudopilin PulG